MSINTIVTPSSAFLRAAFTVCGSTGGDMLCQGSGQAVHVCLDLLQLLRRCWVGPQLATEGRKLKEGL